MILGNDLPTTLRAVGIPLSREDTRRESVAGRNKKYYDEKERGGGSYLFQEQWEILSWTMAGRGDGGSSIVVLGKNPTRRGKRSLEAFIQGGREGGAPSRSGLWNGINVEKKFSFNLKKEEKGNGLGTRLSSSAVVRGVLRGKCWEDLVDEEGDIFPPEGRRIWS